MKTKLAGITFIKPYPRINEGGEQVSVVHVSEYDKDGYEAYSVRLEGLEHIGWIPVPKTLKAKAYEFKSLGDNKNYHRLLNESADAEEVRDLIYTQKHEGLITTGKVIPKIKEWDGEVCSVVFYPSEGLASNPLGTQSGIIEEMKKAGH